MDFLNLLFNSFQENSKQHAFCIENHFYTYNDLQECIDGIRSVLRKNELKNETLYGLVTNNDLETYASIFALWFEGKAYIPINPKHPIKRTQEIFTDTDIRFVLNSLNDSSLESEKIREIPTKSLRSDDDQLFRTIQYEEAKTAYILYTSGSTGKPKGIPISFKNLNALFQALNEDSEFVLNTSDKCLQMYDLTFDASLTALLPGLLVGACIYTVPPDSMKYFKILKLITQYDLTVLKMVPSIIYYLRPYFSKIQASSVRYCIFGGGKLFEDIILEWMECVPNAKIINHYGPTESTVCSSFHIYRREKPKTNQGIISIGKPWAHLDYLIIDEEGEEVESQVKGELCISGDQLTSGYVNNKVKNEEVFFKREVDGISKIFYRSGDICLKDDEGDYMYVDRIDFQVKVRGYRVELSEIEHHAKVISKIPSLMVIDILNKLGNSELALIIAHDKVDFAVILNHLKEKLPEYMIPTKTLKINDFPVNLNGKIDREKVRQLFYNK